MSQPTYAQSQPTYAQPPYVEPYADQRYANDQYADQRYEQAFFSPGLSQPQWGQPTYTQPSVQPHFHQPTNDPPAGANRSWLPVMIATVVVALAAVGVALVVVLGDKTTGATKDTATAAPPMDPATVVQTYVQAAKAGDVAAAKQLVCSSEQANVESNADFSQIAEMDFTVGEAVVDGQEAKVMLTATFQGQSSSVAVGLIQESAQWKICSMTPVEAS